MKDQGLLQCTSKWWNGPHPNLSTLTNYPTLGGLYYRHRLNFFSKVPAKDTPIHSF